MFLGFLSVLDCQHKQSIFICFLLVPRIKMSDMAFQIACLLWLLGVVLRDRFVPIIFITINENK